MKMSFSLSSLQPSGDGLERAEHAKIRADRPYNSLTKKRKEPMQEQGTKNWSGPEDSKDDFWAAIRTNYDFIMDTNLIDTCKEANGELSWDEGDVSTVSWGLKEVSCQFSELYSWLRVLQELVYSKEENLLDKSLRAAHTEELRRKAYRRRLFNEQAEKLIARAPSLKEEVSWRVDHLNAKWDLVEQIMTPVQRPDELDNQDVSADFEHEVKCLRKWLREMEARLQPLNFRVDWSRTEIEEKAMEHMVLQRDIEAHGRIVSSVVKLGERVAGRNQQQQQQQLQQAEQQQEQQQASSSKDGGGQSPEEEQEQRQQEKQQQRQQALRVASSLERRWHLLFLRALEWQCHIEALAARVRTKPSTSSRCSSDSDDEGPATKQPRLSRRQSSNGINSPTNSSSSSSASSTASSQDEARTSNGISSGKSSPRRRSSLRPRRQTRSRNGYRSSPEGLAVEPEPHSRQLLAGTDDTASKSSEFSSSSSASDSDGSSENKSVDDGSYFEDDLDELCITTSVSADVLSIPVKSYSPNGPFGDQGAEADIEEAGLSEEEPEILGNNMSPNPEPVPTAAAVETIDEVDGRCGTEKTNDSPKRRRTDIDEAALRFNTSNRKSKNCATFYFKHMDTDSEADNNNGNAGLGGNDVQTSESHSRATGDESTEEEWTYITAVEPSQSSAVRKQLAFDSEDATSEEGKRSSDRLNGNLLAGRQNSDEKLRENNNNNNNNNDSEEVKLMRERIQKLVKDVEWLVRQGTQGSHRVPQLAFEEDANGLLGSQSNRAKYNRIKQWLDVHTRSRSHAKSMSQFCQLTAAEPLDSGDASNECTDDSEVERQVDAYESFERELSNRSSSYYRSEPSPRSEPNDNLEQQRDVDEGEDEPFQDEAAALPYVSTDTSSPKVVMRSRNRRSSARPWSVSGIPQIKKRGSSEMIDEALPQHSISETALNKLGHESNANSSSLDSAGSRVPLNNSTSTLLGEQIIAHDARVVRNSSLRRRKNRLRKKNTSRKSESSTDGANIPTTCSNNHSQQSAQQQQQQFPVCCEDVNLGSRVKVRRRSSRTLTALSKSGSFSGCSQQQQLTVATGSERTSSWSDPQSKPPRKTSSESEDEEEEAVDVAVSKVIVSTVTASASAVQNCRAQQQQRASIEDSLLVGRTAPTASDAEYSSFGNTSLEAWDYYLDKYSSEPYSESIDHEAVRRLTEFGDDYRNFIDSQSDCASAYSLNAVYVESRAATSEESESDSETKRLTEMSRNQLLLTEARYGCPDSNLNELTRVCRENVRCLRAISETRCVSRHSDRHGKQIRGLMERWESLSLRAEEAQKINAIHREMAVLKMEFCAAHERLASYRVVLEEPHVIEDRINIITNELANLRDRKPAMLALNVSTHRLVTDLGQKTSPTFAALKEGVADLYRLWDEAFQKGNQQLCALQAIQQFGMRLTELQCALRRDKDTLAVLDAALKAGATTEVASSVKDVARLLSEKHEVNNQQTSVLDSSSGKLSTSSVSDDSGNGTMQSSEFGDANSTSLSVGHEGGSLSDSGISDSGSEQELSERERRLAALRRLTRSLESQLMPESSADGILRELWRRVEDAEADLRALQSQCRELIVRTAASVEARANGRPVASVQSYPIPSKRKKIPQFETSTPNGKARSNAEVNQKVPGSCTATDDPDSEPSVPRSWVWRILRAALPFQLALVVLFCAACLLEPHCCEASNSLNLSLTPQLRYVRGPPPV